MCKYLFPHKLKADMYIAITGIVLIEKFKLEMMNILTT